MGPSAAPALGALASTGSAGSASDFGNAGSLAIRRAADSKRGSVVNLFAAGAPTESSARTHEAFPGADADVSDVVSIRSGLRGIST